MSLESRVLHTDRNTRSQVAKQYSSSPHLALHAGSCEERLAPRCSAAVQHQLPRLGVQSCHNQPCRLVLHLHTAALELGMQG